jgi:hypothetical protein
MMERSATVVADELPLAMETGFAAGIAAWERASSLSCTIVKGYFDQPLDNSFRVLTLGEGDFLLTTEFPMGIVLHCNTTGVREADYYGYGRHGSNSRQTIGNGVPLWLSIMPKNIEPREKER